MVALVIKDLEDTAINQMIMCIEFIITLMILAISLPNFIS